MHWINLPTRGNARPDLPIGTVCWVYSKDTQRCQAAVFAEDGWRCHGQEHFYVSGVSRFIVLPTK